MDGTVSFRVKGERNTAYPSALPVFSVDTVEDAEMLQVRLCALSWDGTRYVWPGFYDESLGPMEQLAKMDEVAAEMNRTYDAALQQAGRPVDVEDRHGPE